MNKISYSTIGFSDRNVDAAIESVAAAGFAQTEILGQEPHVALPPTGRTLAEFDRRLKSLALSASVHAPLTTNVLGAPDEQWRREKVGVLTDYLNFSSAIGARVMVVHPVPNPIFVHEPDRPELSELIYDAARRSLDELTPIAQKASVCIIVENLPYQCFYPLQDMRQLRDLVDSYPPDCVGLVIDTGHAGASSRDPAEEIRIAGDRLYGTHLHDMDPQIPEDKHWLPTHGGLNWDAIHQALQGINYAGALTFEVLNPRNGESPEELGRLTRQFAEDW